MVELMEKERNEGRGDKTYLLGNHCLLFLPWPTAKLLSHASAHTTPFKRQLACFLKNPSKACIATILLLPSCSSCFADIIRQTAGPNKVLIHTSNNNKKRKEPLYSPSFLLHIARFDQIEIDRYLFFLVVPCGPFFLIHNNKKMKAPSPEEMRSFEQSPPAGQDTDQVLEMVFATSHLHPMQLFNSCMLFNLLLACFF